MVIVQFDLGVDVDQAAIDVRDRVERCAGSCRRGGSSIVQKFDIGAMPIMDLALSGPQGVDALYDWPTWTCASASPAWTAWPACRSSAAAPGRWRSWSRRTGSRPTASPSPTSWT
jgi:hypothetical protein